MSDDLHPIKEPMLAEIGNLMVSVQVDADEDSARLRAEYDAVMEQLRYPGSPTLALMQMSWIALRAIERCRRLEGSDVVDDRAGGRDGARPGDDAAPARAWRSPPCGAPTRASAP